jgi:hypothetical protein
MTASQGVFIDFERVGRYLGNGQLAHAGGKER